MTDKAVLRCSLATNNVEKILNCTEEVIGMRATYGTHKPTKSADNFEKLVSVTKEKGDMFHHDIPEQIGHGPSAKNELINVILIRTSGNLKILFNTLSTSSDCNFFQVCQVCNMHMLKHKLIKCS